MAEEKNQSKQMQIKIDDDRLRGTYANAMQVSHTKEEFVLDFINMFPPQGIINSRVITSPGHVKRIITALNENVRRYEEQFGQIEEASAPDAEFTIN